MNKTSIEYLTHTWNPIAMRCTPVSEACDNCWHLRTADRMKNNPKLPIDVREALAGDRKPFVTDRINDPLKHKNPSIIGVQFMGDLFHEKIPLINVVKIFDRIHQAKHHIFLILTKRPQRTIEFAEKYGLMPQPPYGFTGSGEIWPENAWFGVTAENQPRVNERLSLSLQVPAKVHFVSLEPLLSMTNVDDCMRCQRCGYSELDKRTLMDHKLCDADGTNLLKWVVCGAETGPHKRPMNLDWARSLRNQCSSAGVPFFFKKDSNGNRGLDGKIWEQFPDLRKK